MPLSNLPGLSHGASRRFPGETCEVPKLPPLLPAQRHIKTILRSSIKPSEVFEDPKITQSRYIASYNLLEEGSEVILVPGRRNPNFHVPHVVWVEVNPNFKELPPLGVHR